jgi:myo-inositol-1-phosphate synthase
MPPALKQALAREVGRRGSTMNDVAVELLAARFGVSFEPSGRKGNVPGASGAVLLRVPPELKRRLKAAADASASTTNTLIIETLANELERKGPMAQTNGKKNGRVRSAEKVRVAIIGVGNCANSLLQGVEYYKDADPDEFVPGLMHVDLGGYHIRDIEFTAAFDITTDKVGKDLADAIWAHPNDTYKFADVPKTGITVSRGMTHDGIGKYMSDVVRKAEGPTDDVVGILQKTGTDVVVNYLPVGSEQATKWYTEQILNAGCAMVNCMPVFIAREDYWQKRFLDRGLPIIGDDIKSQVGATITHRVLTSLFRDRGVRLDKTMQLNVGGNSDFLNMLERERLESKKISKTNAVTSMLDYDIGERNVHVGPSDYVPWLTDRKWAYIRMEGSAFGDVPLNLELKLEVWDSPNSAGIVIDAVRLAKLALNNGLAGALEAPSAYLMKSPPRQIQDDEAREQVDAFIKKHARSAKKAKAPART